MLLFQITILFFVAGLTCLRHPVVYGKEDLETSLEKADPPKHREKRWLWGGCGFIPGCEKCSDGLICNKCRPIFTPVEYERNKKKIIRCSRSCPPGYNVTSTREYPKICVRTQFGCSARHCEDCEPHNPVSCVNCTQGYYSVQKRVMGNVKCVKQCPDGFTPSLNTDGKMICKDTQSKCQSFVPKCATCLDSVRCRKCRSDLHVFFNKTGMACIQNCPRGFVSADSHYFGKYCKRPLVECRSISNCERCPDKINCRRCKPKFYKLKTNPLSHAKCVSSCPAGFKRKGRRCQRIREDGCSGEYCLTCKDGWYRVNYNKRHCQRKCPKGFYILGEKQKFCLRCLARCEECMNGFDCGKCDPGTFKLVQGLHTSCVTSCPFGYASHGNVKTGRVCTFKRIT